MDNHIKNKIIKTLKDKSFVLFITVEFITIICFFLLAGFDLERSSSLINIIKISNDEIKELALVGLIWAGLGVLEFLLAINRPYGKLLSFYRNFVSCIIPFYIAYKLAFLNIEIYSSDIMLFILLPICQISLNVIARINKHNEDLIDYIR